MGVKKRLSADKMKEARKNIAFAKLTNVPSSPRKMWGFCPGDRDRH